MLPFSPLPIWNVKNPFHFLVVGIVVLVFKYCLTLSTFSADISFQIWEIKFYAYYLFSPSKDTLFPWTTWPDKSINLGLLVKPLRVLVLRYYLHGVSLNKITRSAYCKFSCITLGCCAPVFVYKRGKNYKSWNHHTYQLYGNDMYISTFSLLIAMSKESHVKGFIQIWLH